MRAHYHALRRLLKKHYAKKSYFILDLLLKIALALWAAYLVLAFGEPEKFWQLLREPGFLIQWMYNTVITFLLLVMVWISYIVVDNRWPWKHWKKRVPIHILVCIALPLMMAVLCGMAYFGAHGIWIGDTSYANDIFLLAFLFILTANAYQAIWKSTFLLWRLNAVVNRPVSKSAPMEIHGHLGNRRVALLVKDCAYFKREGKELAVFTFANQKYYVDGETSIKQLEGKLGKELFCKINYGCIVNRNAIAESIRRARRSYGLRLIPPLEEGSPENEEELLVVSQGCYSDYKTWMGLP